MSSHIPRVQVRHSVIAIAAVLLGISLRTLHLHPLSTAGMALLSVSVGLFALIFMNSRRKHRHGSF